MRIIIWTNCILPLKLQREFEEIRNEAINRINVIVLADYMVYMLGYCLRKVPMTRWQPPEFYDTGLLEYIGREVAPMTAYEIISIFIGIVALLMSFGSVIVALLAFLDKEKSSSRKSRRK